MLIEHPLVTYNQRRYFEMAEILALAARSGMFAQPARSPMSPKMADRHARAALLDKCRGMGSKNESPWVTYRHLIRRGKVKLIRRPGKPPLLVAVKPLRGHI